MQRRSAVRDSSPNAPACRSRRGEATEGSPVFSPRVEARSAEDRGRGCLERYTTPPGCRTYQGVRQPVRPPSGVVGLLVMPDPRVFGATPLDLWLWSGHPQGVLRSPPFIMSWMSSVPFKCVTPSFPRGGGKKERDGHQTISLLFLCLYPQRIRRSTWQQWWDGRGRPPGGGYCTPSSARYR